MRSFTALAAIAFVLASPAFAAGSAPPASNYRFELAGSPQPAAAGQHVVSVRLVGASNKVIIGATITQAKLDMGPENMAAMTAQVREMTDTVRGIYSFSFDDSAVWKWKGDWALTLTAKVPGSPQAVTGRIIFHAGT